MSGWWAKHLTVYNYLKKKYQNLELQGIVMAPGIEDDIFTKFPETKVNLDLQYDLVKIFLENKPTTKEIDFFEKRYGNLWKYVIAERRYLNFIFNKKFQSKSYNHQELINLIIGKFKYFEKKLKNCDAVISTPAASSWALIMTDVAFKLGKKVICIDQVGFPKNRGILTESNKQIWTSVEKKYSINKNLSYFSSKTVAEAKSLINDWRIKSKSTVPWTKLTETQKPLSKYFNKKKIYRFVNHYIKYFKGESYYLSNPFLMISQHLSFRLRNIIIKRFYNYGVFNKNEKYFYYPLHMEPEANLMINGTRGLNQIALLQKIAIQLPFEYKLYVKEHPTMVGWRLKSDYHKISKIPNLKIIDPNINGKIIVSNSKGVITVNGTTGWEALLLKKPVLLIGAAFYRKLPMVRYIQDLDFIKDELNWLFYDYKHNEEELIKFTAAIIENSFELPFEYFWGITDDEMVFTKLEKLDNITKNIAVALNDFLKIKNEH